MRWLDRLRGKHRRKPPNWLFPDWGLRRDRAGMLGMFEPANLELYLNAEIGAGEERALIRDGRIEDARELVRKNASVKSEEERFEYALRVTTELHELRHVHDYFGTTWGFERFLRTVADGASFHKMWNSLDRTTPVRLPLMEWARDDRSPEALREYARAREEFVAWALLQQGIVTFVPWSADASANVTLQFSVKGLSVQVPTVPINFERARTGERSRKMLPLGGNALLEGAAIVVQHLALTYMFEDNLGSRLKSSLVSGPVDDDTWIYYIAVDRLLTSKLGRFWDRYLTALVDLALMASPDVQANRRHPGVRLDLAVAAASSLGPRAHENPDRDLMEYQEIIAKKCGWLTPRQLVEQRIAATETKLAGLDAKVTTTSTTLGLWNALVRAADQTHLACLKARNAGPDLFANPSFYIRGLGALPPAPVRVEPRRSQFRAVGSDVTANENATAFSQWYLLEYALGRLMFSTTMPCPIPDPHECPGDALAIDWRPNDTCKFSRLLVQLGFPLKWNPLS